MTDCILISIALSIFILAGVFFHFSMNYIDNRDDIKEIHSYIKSLERDGITIIND